MKGDDRILEYLQAAIRAEMTAINQYTLHAALLENTGLKVLAQRWRDEVADEVGHRDRYIARMVFLGGLPDLGILNTVRVGRSPSEIFQADLAAEMEGRALYLEAAKAAFEAGDLVTHELFEDILRDEEGHIDFLETQLRLIEMLGLPNFAARYVDEFEAD